jgi:uncharacterized protein YecT (DUF1311 family)
MGLLKIATVALTLGAVAFSQTQVEMNAAARDEYNSAERELNLVYNRVLKEHAGGGGFLPRFRAAQRAWLAYRDAHIRVMFPEADKHSAYGSAYPLCRYNALAALTRSRIKELNTWLEPADETDVCSGNRPSRRAGASRARALPAGFRLPVAADPYNVPARPYITCAE